MLFKEEDFASGDLTEVFCTMKDIEIECSLFIMLSCYYIAITATKLLLKKRQKKQKSGRFIYYIKQCIGVHSCQDVRLPYNQKHTVRFIEVLNDFMKLLCLFSTCAPYIK